ncbi:hypothetical protein MTO96_040339 [Rhipicephalus appendiculatus]
MAAASVVVGDVVGANEVEAKEAVAIGGDTTAAAGVRRDKVMKGLGKETAGRGLWGDQVKGLWKDQANLVGAGRGGKTMAHGTLD